MTPDESYREQMIEVLEQAIGREALGDDAIDSGFLGRAADALIKAGFGRELDEEKILNFFPKVFAKYKCKVISKAICQHFTIPKTK